VPYHPFTNARNEIGDDNLIRVEEHYAILITLDQKKKAYD
jgi:hypothetical protein